MSLFDINVGFGRAAYPVGGSFDTPEQLLAEMQRLRIDAALVYHQVAAEADVLFGNRLLTEALKGHPNLFPCWFMAPPVLGDLPEPEAWVAEALAAGVRAIRLAPRHSLYSLADWCVGPLLQAIERAGLPVLLDFGTPHWSELAIPWSEVKALCENHPQLNVIVVGATVGTARNATSLLQHLPNLYLEYHTFNAPDTLRLFAEQGLGRKLVFGTGMPRRAGECVVEQTLRSGLKPGPLLDMAGRTARGLLGVVEASGASQLSAAPFGRARGLVIDAHAHCGGWQRTNTFVRTPQAIVEAMHRAGVHKMVVSSFSAIQGATAEGNRQAAAIVAEYPSHLFAYCAVNPHYLNEMAGELARCFVDSPGFIGLKLHCGLHGVQLQDPAYETALTFAQEHELPVLVHGGGEDDWAGVAQRYPAAAFIIAHGCSWDGLDPKGRALYAPVREVGNLYVDVAGSAAWRGALRALIDLVGVRKVLYGSDFPMFDLAFELGRVSLSDLSDAEKVAISGGNALRLFKRIPQDNALD